MSSGDGAGLAPMEIKMTNINRIVEITTAPNLTKGVVVSERTALVRGHSRLLLTIRCPDGSTVEKDARRVTFAMEFLSPAEAEAEYNLAQAIDERMGLRTA